MNFPNGKSEQKEVFPLETLNEKHVSFTSTCEVSPTYPLTQLCGISLCC